MVASNDALARAVETSLGGVRVKVISLADLIENKRASGRPQDLVDLAVLERALATSKNAKK